MLPVLAVLQLALLAASGFAVVIAVLTAVSYPSLRSRLSAIPPAHRACLLRWICGAPLGGAVVLTAICLLPSLLALVSPELDHCVGHHGHLHVCLRHPPASLAGPIGWSLNTLFVGLLGFGFATVAGRTLKAAISLRAIWRAAEYDATIDAHVVRSALPFSAVIGLFSQRIVLSTALAHALPAPLMRVVLAHERTHLLRHDSFWQLAAAFVSLGHFPSLRRHLLADLALAAEQACDERAADLSGDRLTVASTILFVERLFANRPSLIASAPAFGGSDVAARVDALLHPVIEPPVWMLRGVGVAIALLIAALTPSATLHHWTETLLGLLLG